MRVSYPWGLPSQSRVRWPLSLPRAVRFLQQPMPSLMGVRSRRNVTVAPIARSPGWKKATGLVEVEVSIIAWIVLGAIAGWLAGLLVKGDERLGVIGHILLGIAGAVIGGFLAGVLFGTDPIDGPFDISSIVTAVIGAVILVVGYGLLTGRGRSGAGPV
jgi:uncharacterized membrane protein YeaQ/YmgE (transglycosylase-associated protein family)